MIVKFYCYCFLHDLYIFLWLWEYATPEYRRNTLCAIKHSFTSGPALTATPSKLLSPALYLNVARRRARIAPPSPPLPISSFYHLFHPFDGIRRARRTVLRYKSPLGGPPNPLDTNEVKEICPRGNNKVVIYISLYHDKCLLFMLELY